MGTRPTKASGACNEIGDVYSDDYYVECKEKHTKSCFTLTRKEWLKLQAQTPVTIPKVPIWVIENKFGEKVVIMNIEDFLRRINE